MVALYMAIDQKNRIGKVFPLHDFLTAQVHQVGRLFASAQEFQLSADCFHARGSVEPEHSSELERIIGVHLFGGFDAQECHEQQRHKGVSQPVERGAYRSVNLLHGIEKARCCHDCNSQ